MSSSSISRTAALTESRCVSRPSAAIAWTKASNASRKWVLESQSVSSASKTRFSGEPSRKVIQLSIVTARRKAGKLRHLAQQEELSARRWQDCGPHKPRYRKHCVDFQI